MEKDEPLTDFRPKEEKEGRHRWDRQSSTSLGLEEGLKLSIIDLRCKVDLPRNFLAQRWRVWRDSDSAGPTGAAGGTGSF